MRQYISVLFIGMGLLLGMTNIGTTQQLSSISVSPVTIFAGAPAYGSVTLTTAAPTGGIVVNLSSSNTSYATVPPTVTVPAGSTTASFLVATGPIFVSNPPPNPPVTQTVTITASYKSIQQQFPLTTEGVVTQTLNPAASTYVQAGTNANMNFGGSQYLITGRATNDSSSLNNYCSYITFDLTQVKSAPLSATLELPVDSSSNPSTGTETVNIYSVYTPNQNLGGVTWNNAPGLNTTNFTSTGTLLNTQNVPLQAGTAAFDISRFISANIGQVVTLQIIDNNIDNPYLYLAFNKSMPTMPSLVLTFTRISQEIPAPEWAENNIPADSVPTGSFGPSSADDVVLSSGVYENNPDPDIVVWNPIGPTVYYQRQYRSSLAARGYASPGLTAGWVDNYDYRIQSLAQPGTWGPLELIYPNGAGETWNVPGGGGIISPPSGTPYIVTGQASGITGQWQWLKISYKDQSTWKFTQDPLIPNGYRLNQITDLFGNFVTINRDSQSDCITTIADTNNNTLLSFGYNPYQSVWDKLSNRIVRYTYAAQGSLYNYLSTVSMVALQSDPTPLPVLWQYDYSTYGGQPFMSYVSVPNPTGKSGMLGHSINYDFEGTVTSIVDANNNQRTYTYGTGMQNSTQVQVSGGGQSENWTQNFDSLGQTTGVVDGKMNSTRIYFNDPNNPRQPTQLSNKENQSTNMTYDQLGNCLSCSEPEATASLTTSATFNMSGNGQMGQLRSLQEGSKAPTSYYYNPNGSIQSILAPTPGTVGGGSGVTTSYTYTTLGNIATVTIPGPNSAGGTVTYTYSYTNQKQTTEALGEPVSITDPNHNVTQFQYDNRGNVTAFIDALDYETDYQYNYDNQLVKITYPATGQTGSGNAKTVYTYLNTLDSYTRGSLVTETDYDESGNIVRTINCSDGSEDDIMSVSGNIPTMKFKYDSFDHLQQIIDGNNNIYNQYYDSVDNLVKLTYPLYDGIHPADSYQYAYDSEGNVTQRTDGLNQVTTYNLNPSDSSIQSVSYPPNTLPNVQYQYDSYGRVSQMQDGTATINYTYDDLDNPLTITTQYNGLPAETISYTYNTDGTRASMTTPAGTYNYLYDNAGNLTDVTMPWVNESGSPETVHYDYDADNRVYHQHTYKVDTYLSYNSRGWLIDITNKNTALGAALLSEFNFPLPSTRQSYDALGNRLYMNITSPAPNGTRIPDISGDIIYQYDTTSSFSPFFPDALNYEERDLYYTDDYGASYTYTYAFDADDNFATFQFGGEPTYSADDQLYHIWYDGNGNRDLYTYDVENRLINYRNTTVMDYTADGHRAWKWVANGGSGIYHYYLYDGDTVVCELNQNGAVTMAYGYGANGLAESYSSGLYTAYTFDPQGTVLARYQQNGTTAYDTSVYDVYGNLRDDINATLGSVSPPDPVGFCGQWGCYTDVDTGLVLMGHRYYDPTQGRFITRDPIGYQGGINLYAYSNNNPANYNDPTGLDVDMTWNGTTGQLVVEDKDRHGKVRQKFTTYAFSGVDRRAAWMGKNYVQRPWWLSDGAIPPGKYLVGKGKPVPDMAVTPHIMVPVYKLYGQGNPIGGYGPAGYWHGNDPSGHPIVRTGLEFHPGRYSWGCISLPAAYMLGQGPKGYTYPNSKDWIKLKKILDNTTLLNYKGDTYKGWLHVYYSK